MIPNILEKASDMIWMKVDKAGGRKGKEDRISERKFTGEAR